MTKKHKELPIQISKVVYFDEGSVTDFLQITAGGELSKTSELLEESTLEAGAAVEAKASFGLSKVFRSLLGLDLGISAEAQLGGNTKTGEMAHNILQNTILTDFCSLVEKGQSKSIVKFSGYRIGVIKESLGYYIMLSPYMSMLQSKNGIRIDNMPDMSLAIDKFDSSLRLAKGYYELIGVNDLEANKRVVFRFNLNAFRNNYKITDLTKMDMTIFAIKVGRTTADKLDIKSELDIPVMTPATFVNPSYDELERLTKEKEGINIDTSRIEIYDVLLAGVAEI